MSTPIQMAEHDAIKFISINREAILEKTFRFLDEYMTYEDRDKNLQEDLYTIHEAYDSYNSLDLEVQSKISQIGVQLKTMKDLADQWDASYVRFIK